MASLGGECPIAGYGLPTEYRARRLSRATPRRPSRLTDTPRRPGIGRHFHHARPYVGYRFAMPTFWRKWIAQLASSRPVDEAKLEVAREFGREAAGLLYPTMQWEEARLTLAAVWDEKNLMPWREARPAVHAAWLLAKAEFDVARRRKNPEGRSAD